MNLTAPPTRDPLIPIFFNVDASVGAAAANSSREDILLVQLLLKKNGEVVPASNPQAKLENEIMKKVAFTGVADPATIAAIQAFQQSMKRKAPGTIVDGRVSPARNSATFGAGTRYTIVNLNGFLRRHMPKIWPRFQDVPDCPGELKKRFAEVL